MDLKNALIESGNTRHRKNWKGVGTSLLAHGMALAAVIVASFGASGEVAAEDKPIPVYVQASAPPPPPPPPPPAAGSSSPAPQQPDPVVQPQPVEIPPDNFVAPTEEPEDLPDVVPTTTPTPTETPITATNSLGNFTASAPTAQPGGVPGGVAGGIQGGEIGGVIGGQIGGVVGGVVGGTVGGQVGGQVGGTGTAPAPAPPEPALPTGPVRVGGNVKAPTITSRPEPEYTELARRSRITGVVVLEAVIDKHGNVDRVKVIKGLPMGLSESAAAAVKRWKFKPGTMGGKPIDVIFNLTVNFRLGADTPGMKVRRTTPAAPEAEAPTPEPEPEPEAPAEAPQDPPATGEGG